MMCIHHAFLGERTAWGDGGAYSQKVDIGSSSPDLYISKDGRRMRMLFA